MAKKAGKYDAFIRSMDNDPNMGANPKIQGKKGAKMPKDFKVKVIKTKKK